MYNALVDRIADPIDNGTDGYKIIFVSGRISPWDSSGAEPYRCDRARSIPKIS
jgi:hypothetical protein